MTDVRVHDDKSIWKTSFSAVRASGVDPDFAIVGGIPGIGVGQAVSQSGGNLVLTSGTTANAETLIRSVTAFNGNMLLRYIQQLSQRIANNAFTIELTDVMGDGLAFNCDSATSLTVTIPNHGLDPTNIGQSVYVGNFAGAPTPLIPGRYPIAAINGDNVSFTVSGFPTSGTGTCSVWGWNYFHVVYDGTTATQAKFDAQRNGWNSGDTTLTTVTSAAPGHMLDVNIEDGTVGVSDQLVASSSTGPTVTFRGSRVAAIPDADRPLFLQIRMTNGSTAPASTTTWTIGMLSVERYKTDPVQITGVRPQTLNAQLPVSLVGSLMTGTSSLAIQGAIADDGAAASYNPVIVGGKARNANPAAVSATGDADSLLMTMIGAAVVRPYSIPEAEWQSVTTITNTTSTAIKAAAAAGIKNYLTGFQYQNTNATATTFNILRGTTVIASFSAPASMANPVAITFPTPLQSAAAEALNVQAGTTAANLIVNAQGFISP